MLFRKKQYISSGSLSAEAWKKLKQNRLSFSALLFIIFIATVALMGYLVTPDHTPYANEQHVELAIKKPGFKVDVLKVRKNEIMERPGILNRMLFGEKNRVHVIPINSYRVDGSDIVIIEYSTEPGFDMPEIRYPKADVVGIETRTYIFGTDRFGRDMFSRLLIGTRVSLSVGFISVFISLLIGITIGSLGGFFRGWVDNVVVWLINVVWSIPTLLLVIAITFALGKGFWQVFVAVGLTTWVEVARVSRGQILSIREKEFVEAGRALGFGNFRIIFRHILPNIMGPVIVISAANFASAILIEAGLSFLGIGVQPPIPSWGSMIKESYAYIILEGAYMAILPGFCIMVMVFAFMILGNGLGDALDVKTA